MALHSCPSAMLYYWAVITSGAREKAKLDQLEIDAVTPLYEGCRPEDTRLKVTLMALAMKVKHKMTIYRDSGRVLNDSPHH